MRALNDFIIVKPDPIKMVEDKRSGLTKEVIKSLQDGKLFVPETCENAVNKQPSKGTIVSVGPLCNKLNGLKPGLRVYFGLYCSAKETIEKEEYLSMKESDLISVL